MALEKKNIEHILMILFSLLFWENVFFSLSPNSYFFVGLC